jgi:hypothetical protein
MNAKNLSWPIRIPAIVALLIAAVAGMKAQDKKTTPVNVPVVAALPADVSSPEAIVKTDYECISGGVGAPRQWARDFSLYDPHARSFTVDKDSKTGALAVWTPTAQEYTDATDAIFVREGFTERELAHKIVRFGNIATVFSSYEGRMMSTGKIVGTGVNTYQLYSDGKRWWISSVSWDSTTTEIPADLQPTK